MGASRGESVKGAWRERPDRHAPHTPPPAAGGADPLEGGIRAISLIGVIRGGTAVIARQEKETRP